MVNLFPRFFTDGKERQTGRQHQRFLRAGHVDVDVPFVGAAFHRAEAADGVHQQQDRGGGHQFAEGGEIVSYAGAGFAQRGENRGGVGMIREGFGQLFRLHSLAVGNGDIDRLDIEGFADVAEALAEPARDQADGFALGRQGVDDGGFERPGTGAGQRDDGLAGLKNILKALQYFEQNLPGFRSAMINDRLGQLEEGFFGNGSRSRRQQPLLHLDFLGSRSRARSKRVNQNRLLRARLFTDFPKEYCTPKK